MLLEPSYNFIKDLNVLFVDIDNRYGRLEYNGAKRFLQSDTLLWDFVHEYVPLKSSPVKIDALNVHDVLRANNMGYTHIEVNGRRWEDIPPSEQNQMIANFKANVRKLKPQLLIVLGRKTYNRLFQNEVPQIRGKMTCGFKKHQLEWPSKDGIKENSKVFLMRKRSFKSAEERTRIGKSLKKGMGLLNAFRKKHGGVFHPVRNTTDKKLENKNRKLAFKALSQKIYKLAEPDNILYRTTKRTMGV